MFWAGAVHGRVENLSASADWSRAEVDFYPYVDDSSSHPLDDAGVRWYTDIVKGEMRRPDVNNDQGGEMQVRLDPDEVRLRGLINDLVAAKREVDVLELIGREDAFSETLVIRSLFRLEAEGEFAIRFMDEHDVEFTGPEIVDALNGNEDLEARGLKLLVRRAD